MVLPLPQRVRPLVAPDGPTVGSLDLRLTPLVGFFSLPKETPQAHFPFFTVCEFVDSDEGADMVVAVIVVFQEILHLSSQLHYLHWLGDVPMCIFINFMLFQ